MAVRYAVALGLAVGLVGPAWAAPVPEAPGRSVYVVSHGWHVGIALRRTDLPATSRLARSAPGPLRYLEIGWGDSDYYPATRGTIALAVRAAFDSRGAVLHVVGFDEPVVDAFPGAKIVRIVLSGEGFASLTHYIEATYAVDREDAPIVVAPAEYGVGLFYRPRGRYGLLNNSNRWVAHGLEIAGCPIDANVAVTAGAERANPLRGAGQRLTAWRTE